MNSENRCHVCGTTNRERYWHTTSGTYLDRAVCRRADREQGVWLCTICEDGVHRWMKDHPYNPQAANEGVEEMVRRLRTAIFAPRRTKRRRTDKP